MEKELCKSQDLQLEILLEINNHNKTDNNGSIIIQEYSITKLIWLKRIPCHIYSNKVRIDSRSLAATRDTALACPSANIYPVENAQRVNQISDSRVPSLQTETVFKPCLKYSSTCLHPKKHAVRFSQQGEPCFYLRTY